MFGIRQPQKFSTTILFDIAAGRYDGQAECDPELHAVISQVFPSIKYGKYKQGHIISDYVAPQILQQHPSLESFSTAAEAVEKLGQELPVRKAKRDIKGFSWIQMDADRRHEALVHAP